MQAAAQVTCPTAATRASILRHQLLPPDRVTVVPNGVHTSLSPLPDRIADGAQSRDEQRRRPERLTDGRRIGLRVVVDGRRYARAEA